MEAVGGEHGEVPLGERPPQRAHVSLFGTPYRSATLTMARLYDRPLTRAQDRGTAGRRGSDPRSPMPEIPTAGTSAVRRLRISPRSRS